MDQAKSAIKEHLGNSGHHNTTVHENVAQGVTRDTQHTHHHENVTSAIDKEIHQDHYHTSVQPIHHEERLAEKHHHNVIPVEHRNIEHGNDADVQSRLKTEAAKFKDETIKGETKHTSSVQPTVAGEHIHHHVHETIQPVVHKQTVQPHVTHTTVPIHEVHHNAAQHHSSSALPAVSMADFKKQGGVLTGREERYDGFEGEPKHMIGKTANSSSFTGGDSTTGTGGNAASNTAGGLTGHHHGHHSQGTTGSGLTGNNTTGSGLTGSSGTHTGGLTGNNTTGSGLTGNNTTGSGLTGSHGGVVGNTENKLEREAVGSAARKI